MGRTSTWPPDGRARSRPFPRICHRPARLPSETLRGRAPLKTSLWFDGPERDQELVIGIMVVQFFLAQFPHRQPFEKRHGGEYVPVGLYLHVRIGEDLFAQPPRSQFSQSPAIALAELLAARLPDTREGRKQDAAGLQYAPQRPERGANIVNKMESLRTDDAVESVGRNILGAGEIGDDGSLLVGLVHIEHIPLRDTFASVLSGIGRVMDFQHAPSDVLRMAGEKSFDVVAINGPSSVQAELAADGIQPPKVAEVYLLNLHPASTSAPPSGSLHPPLEVPVLIL